METDHGLQIAVDRMKSTVREVNAEISFIEHEMLEEGDHLKPDHAIQLKIHLEKLLKMIDDDVTDLVEKVKRLDHGNTSGADNIFDEQLPAYLTLVVVAARQLTQTTTDQWDSRLQAILGDSSRISRNLNYLHLVEKLRIGLSLGQFSWT